MLFLIFYFVIAAVMLFQGLHLAMETTQPLGTLPEEVGQDPKKSQGLGAFVASFGVVMALVGLLGYKYEAMEAYECAFFYVALAILAMFGLWVIFGGRTVEFMGKPSADDHH